MRTKYSQTTEDRLRNALDYLHQNPDSKASTVTKEFKVTRGQLRSRLDGHSSSKEQTSINTKLSYSEEKALCRYIDRLDSINLHVRQEFVVDAANAILKERAGKNNTPLTVGKCWIKRFLKRHSYDTVKQKVLEQNRQVAENPKVVREWFEKLRKVIQEEGILPEDIYNMDETGFQIGVGKDQLVITKRKRAHYFGLPINRESATAIEAIRGNGEVIPLFIILSGSVHMGKWYQIDQLDKHSSITVSPTGYTNDQISLDWIKHFDTRTKTQTVGRKRLLIMDGYGSHHTTQFLQYCDDNNIIPFGLPPHITHILQPLDVCCFQPLKHYHAKAIDIVVRDGCTNITKVSLYILFFIRILIVKD